MKFVIVFGMMALGFLLLVLSGLWTTLFPGTSTWTPDKAARSSEVKSRLYNLSFVVNSARPNLQRGEDIGTLKAEYEQLRKENDQLNADFTSATESPKTMSRILKWSGIALAVIGVIGWYAVNNLNG